MHLGCCKHLNGSYHNDTCDAGVCYRDVTPNPDGHGSHFREPCRRHDPKDEHAMSVLADLGPQGTCAKYEEPTAEELAAEEAAVEAHIKKFELTLPLIAEVKKQHKGKAWAGLVKCPVCDGKLHLSHAAINGHVWGRCETEDCLAWME